MRRAAVRNRRGSGFGTRYGLGSFHANLLDNDGGDGDGKKNFHNKEDEGEDKGDVSSGDVSDNIKDGRVGGGGRRRGGTNIEEDGDGLGTGWGRDLGGGGVQGRIKRRRGQKG